MLRHEPVGRLAIDADHDAVTGMRRASPGETSRDKSSSPVLKEATRDIPYGKTATYGGLAMALEGVLLL